MEFKELYKDDIFANETGVVLEEVNDDYAKMHLKVERRHLNGGGYVHGGVVFLLADIAMAAMANHRQIGSVSIQSDIRFLSAAAEGDTLFAKSKAVFGGKTLNNCRVDIVNQDGKMIAIAEGMFYVKQSFPKKG